MAAIHWGGHVRRVNKGFLGFGARNGECSFELKVTWPRTGLVVDLFVTANTEKFA